MAPPAADLLKVTTPEPLDRSTAGQELERAHRREELARRAHEALLAGSLDAVVVTNRAGVVLEWNASAEQAFGWSQDEALGMQVSELLVPPEHREGHLPGLAGVTPDTVPGRPVKLEALRRDGSRIPVEMTLTRAVAGGRTTFVGVLRSLEERSALLAAARQARERLRTVADHAGLAAFVVTAAGCVTLAEGATLAALGLAGPLDATLDPILDPILDPDSDARRGAVAVADLPPAAAELVAPYALALGGDPVRRELEAGGRYWEVDHVPVPGEHGGVGSVLVVARDVTERRQLGEHVESMLQRDGLTGMLNRAGLQAQLHAVLDEAVAHGGRVALLYADVDDFKDVNESLGHAVGDELLAGLARRVVTALPGASLLARHGGDEFLAVLTGSDLDEATVDARAAALLEHLSTPMTVGEVDLDLTASVGVSLYPDDAATPVELLAHADSAMYRAKRGGGGTVVRYSSSSDDTGRRMALTTRLRRALAEAAIDVHYQPIVDLPSGALCKLEALARWTDAEEGPVPPDVFIPLAEASKQIIALGELVIATVARQLAAWDAAGLHVPVVAVNVSAAHLRHDRLLATIDAQMARHGLDAARLEVEFTESAVMADFERTTALIRALRERGVGVAIDDFGTGHSSLARLRDLPVDTVKLDRSFVAPLPEQTAQALVDAFLGLARGLRLRTVAEGVETEQQRDLLVAGGCDTAQGYLFAKPMPAHELPDWLDRQGPLDGASLSHSAE